MLNLPTRWAGGHARGASKFQIARPPCRHSPGCIASATVLARAHRCLGKSALAVPSPPGS
eukprot:15446633-Alexandrium_andersonii.AAC.1